MNAQDSNDRTPPELTEIASGLASFAREVLGYWGEAINWPGAAVGAFIGLFCTFKFFFREKGDFLEALGYWFTPNIVSLMTGNLDEDWWHTMKLWLWIVIGGFCAVSGHNVLFTE